MTLSEFDFKHKNRSKILVVGPIPPNFGSKNPGGVSAHTWLHARLLAERGYTVTLLALGSYFGKSFEKAGISVIGLPRFSLRWALWAGFTAISKTIQLQDFRKSAIVNRFVTKYKLKGLNLEKFDVIHVQSIHGQFQAVVDIELRASKILTVHSYDDVLSSSGRAKERLITKHRLAKSWFDQVIHVSQTDQNKSTALGLSDVNRMVIHNPVEVSSPASPECVEQDIDVLFVGGLTPRKRPELVLQAVRNLGFEVSCTVVGSGPLLQQLRSSYGDTAVFCGFVNHSEVLKLMARSRVLCVPSVSESFGLVYVEAALSGAAVIGYRDTISEISDAAGLSEGERLYFVGFDPNESDPTVMVNALKSVLSVDGVHQQKSSSAIYSKLFREFSGDAYIQKILDCYGLGVNE
jgi:glycosyltransferase involved in cell wall biosynthesis